MILAYLCTTLVVLFSSFVLIRSDAIAEKDLVAGSIISTKICDYEPVADTIESLAKVTSKTGNRYRLVRDTQTESKEPCKLGGYKFMLVYSTTKLAELCADTENKDKLEASIKPICYDTQKDVHLIDIKFTDGKFKTTMFYPRTFGVRSPDKIGPYFFIVTGTSVEHNDNIYGVTRCAAEYGVVVSTSSDDHLQIDDEKTVTVTIKGSDDHKYSVLDGTKGPDAPCRQGDHTLLLMYEKEGKKKLLTLCTNTKDANQLESSITPICYDKNKDVHLIGIKFTSGHYKKIMFHPSTYGEKSKMITPYLSTEVGEVSKEHGKLDTDVKQCSEEYEALLGTNLGIVKTSDVLERDLEVILEKMVLINAYHVSEVPSEYLSREEDTSRCTADQFELILSYKVHDIKLSILCTSTRRIPTLEESIKPLCRTANAHFFDIQFTDNSCKTMKFYLESGASPTTPYSSKPLGKCGGEYSDLEECRKSGTKIVC